jgi:hypothetical protein
VLARLRPAGGRRKKLIEAARLLAAGLFEDEVTTQRLERERRAKLEADARVWGARLVFRDADRRVPPNFYLYPENVPAWNLLLAVWTQWQRAWDGTMLGLNYDGVDAYLRAHVRPTQRRQRWLELQAMERTCLQTWREQRERERRK